MQKKDIKSRKNGKGRVPYIFLILGIMLVVGMAAAVCCGIRPWQVTSVDATTAEGEVLDEADLPAFIHVSHMDLVFTGMYTVDASQKNILGYYYIGSIGNQTWLVEMPADVSENGLSDAMPDLKDQSFEAVPAADTDIVEMLSKSEGMDVETYKEKYNISLVPLRAGTHLREKQMLEYGIGVIMAIACFMIGHMLAHGREDDREEVDDEKY